MVDFPAIAANYDAFIIDLWGVVHDGTALYPGAADALAYLHAQQKPVLFLSNAPRLANQAQAVLDRLGIARTHYQHLLTSGQAAYDWLATDQPFGARYYYLGPGKDEELLATLPTYQRVMDATQADFILNTGYEVDFQPHHEILPLLKKLALQELPLLCVNPDLEVVKQDGTHMLCAGAVAAAYEKLGGRTHYVGKPYARVYDRCRQMLPQGKLLAIGDNVLTDIKGANAARIDALLITGGVLKTQQGKPLDTAEALAACAAAHVKAHYVLSSFSLRQ